jgi:hypothetical protein
MLELVDSDWDKVIDTASMHCADRLRVVCPFIKSRAVGRLFAHCDPQRIEVITRFSLADFYGGVSDIAALELLLARGAEVRGIRGLHAKLYMFGPMRVVLTSANLTEAALLRNEEFGLLSDDPQVALAAHGYFERLWRSAGQTVTAAQLADWKERVVSAQAAARPIPQGQGLPDFGAVVPNLIATAADSAIPFDTAKAFVKFFGTSTNRAGKTMQSLEEIERSGCHWACTYPKGLTPRAVEDGDVMYIARLVKEPNDTLIFGRARGLRHRDATDVASEQEIAIRPWKREWPLYIRVHHAEFVAGALENGVSLVTLMQELGSDSFVSTQRNAASGNGNTVPSRALMQKAHVQLTPQAFRWLDARLEASFLKHGKVPTDALARLDWPYGR